MFRHRQGRWIKFLTLLKSASNLAVACNSSGWIEPVFGQQLNDGHVGVLGCIAASCSLYKIWHTTVGAAAAAAAAGK